MLKKSPGRPSRIRPTIVAAARELFLEHGLEVRLEAIATKAGTNRQTLYNHFPTKTALLIEVFDHLKTEMEAPFIEQHEVNNKRLDQRLLDIGQAVQNHFYNIDVIRLQRLLIIALVEMKEILPKIQNRTQGNIKRSLSHILETAHNAGLIQVEHPDEAAKAFLGAVMGYAYPATMLGGALPTSQELKKLNQEVCSMFLKAWQYKE
ncbi:TetR/AcrR family transcriptional regulator [Acinetobacter nosocomialis]|uniref:TetR/AcrR family transcriptional regulator n=1 Tax=Acinetobacter nosocomialis TaxID=106654 RepID=UPI001AD965CE|nr:TetR/AcrR family transcriptional regulator [Acinetobacter nosocomialis]MBO8209017.1 TetR/AcrR family transcriptional regulator [Acinetobacter nosocomialis]MBO8225468.1 TetR/AcrR family transcriptional regulator [Acinetobacter nosocomialis]MBO8249223.1 TetR/AcrR family transcriptional regulator [Acinetobacter nosocomialis]MCE7531691.1 TetR/AcrR family transcriptional regulator [Acinetobacter nosocomialis]MDM9639816.1 TetR/AcrR family transcriptional regulator [Acinetobacter nosocomialis]